METIILPKTQISHFLQGLITLTKERDLHDLEQLLKQTIMNLITFSCGAEVKSIEIYRLKDISTLFFSTVDSKHKKPVKGLTPELSQLLLDCYSTAQYMTHEVNGRIVYHLFPLKHEIAHNNSVVLVQSEFDDVHLSESICGLLDIYQNYIGLLNDNERDTLTGLLNRKTFDQKIGKILSNLNVDNKRKSDSNIQYYFLAIFDIDHFKKVNDQYGHLIGDEVLLLLSQLMTKSFRDSDYLFRFGGEEFVGVFGCANEADIQLVIERFTKKLQQYSFPQVGKVTVSIGCTKLVPDVTPSQFVDRADLALYHAKNNGRNQMHIYEDLVEQGLVKEEIKEGEIDLF
jgi:diguanylate cyclase (GGDEF)-like protein